MPIAATAAATFADLCLHVCLSVCPHTTLTHNPVLEESVLAAFFSQEFQPSSGRMKEGKENKLNLEKRGISSARSVEKSRQASLALRPHIIYEYIHQSYYARLIIRTI